MKDVIFQFDIYLQRLGLSFEATIIGGAALNILDISSRKTKDVDCLDPQIPDEIKLASQKFSTERSELLLDPNWLNNGPATLINDLPPGWKQRTNILYHGKALKLEVLGRSDLLKTKLFAYCDRTTPDFEDLKLLKPTQQELEASLSWVKERDGHVNWPLHVEKAFLVLKKALKYE